METTVPNEFYFRQPAVLPSPYAMLSPD